MTLNILFSEYPLREQRLSDIADFLAAEAKKGAPIHIVALQEVVGDLLDKLLATPLGGKPIDGNTAQELHNRLRARGLNYDFRSAFSSGLPGLLSVSNATLSLCEIKFKLVKRLPKTPEFEIDDLKIELGRSVLLTRLELPGFGEVDVVNTHLCAACSIPDRVEQVNVGLRFIEDLEYIAPSELVVLLGDFNTVVNALEDTGQDVYKPIIESGFFDTYALVQQRQGVSIFCEKEFDQGCTEGVSNVDDPLDPERSKNRIDFIFARQQGSKSFSVIDSKVLFNPESVTSPSPPGVSDHSAVVTEFDLRQQ
jgi:maltose 6'-phosphate phosphatase